MILEPVKFFPTKQGYIDVVCLENLVLLSTIENHHLVGVGICLEPYFPKHLKYIDEI